MGAEASSEKRDDSLARESESNKCDLQYHVGVYRSNKGAKGILDLQAGTGLVFHSQGRIPWVSKVSWLESSAKGNVYILPNHPLNSKAQGLGMCLLHRPGDTFVKEYAGDLSGCPSALWTWEGPLATSTGAAEIEAGHSTNPSMEAASPAGMKASPSVEAASAAGTKASPSVEAASAAGTKASAAGTQASPSAEAASAAGTKASPSAEVASAAGMKAPRSTRASPPSVDAASGTVATATRSATASPPRVDATSAAPAPAPAAPPSDIASAGLPPGPPTGTVASVGSQPRSSRKWLIEEVAKARKTVEDAGEITKQLAIEAASQEGLAREPDVPSLGDLLSDLGKMSDSQLQKELERLDLLHQELKDRSDSFLVVRRKMSSMLLRDVEGDSTDVAKLLGPTTECGLVWDRRWQDNPMGPEEEVIRDKVRYGTRDKIAIELGLPEFGSPASAAEKQPPYCSDVRLFRDISALSKQGSAQPGGMNLLGRYDAVCVRARADFDRNFKFISAEKRSFWVLHAAAINIGESRKAADFSDFSKRGVLDQDAYVAAMGHIASNLMRVAIAMRVEEFIFFPFGLGAFLRHLGLLDARFRDDVAMQQLRRRVTQSFVEAFAVSPPSLKVHLCISFQEAEAQENADAFLRAFDAASADLKKRTIVWPDGDCLQLAHELALKSRNVMLVNGANRQAIGNHWFARHAKRAIDENLHRRSWTLSAVSYVINGFGEEGTSSRKPTELRDRVKDIGGAVFCFKGDGISAESGDECVCS